MRLLVLLMAVAAGVFGQGEVIVQKATGGGGDLAPGSLASLFLFPAAGSERPHDVSATISPAGGGSFPVVLMSDEWGDFFFQLPKDTPLGVASISVASSGQYFGSASFTVAATAPSIFVSGRSALIPPYSFINAARPGDYVTLWATGLGGTNDVTVLLGGHPARVTYAGPAPGSPGLDQVNFQVPQDAAIPDGCAVALTIQAGGQVTGASIPKSATGGACRSPYGFLADAVPPYLAMFEISSSLDHPRTADGPLAGFVWSEYASAYEFSENFAIAGDEPLVADDVYYSCSTAYLGVPASILIGDRALMTFEKSISLAGPSGTIDFTGEDYYRNLPEPPAVNDLSTLPPPFFQSGIWRISGEAGATNAAFSQSFKLPAPIRANNLLPSAVARRTDDLSITWDAVTYSDADALTATVFVRQQWFSSALVTCRVPARSGRVVIPAAMMGQLPAGDGEVGLSVRSRPDRLFVFSLDKNTPAVVRATSSQTIPVLLR